VDEAILPKLIEQITEQKQNIELLDQQLAQVNAAQDQASESTLDKVNK